MSLFNHFQRIAKETDTSKLCDSMKEEVPKTITQREMKCIQSNLQQVETKKRDDLFTKKKVNKMSQNMQLSVVLQQALGNLSTYFLI